MSGARERIPVLHLAPWVDYGGTDKGTIDWFRWMDRERFALSLLTTQPSPNRCLPNVAPFAEEVWALPDLMSGGASARFVLDFIASRNVRVLHLMNSRLGYELLPDIHSLPDPPRIVVQLHVEEPERNGYVRYVSTRLGNLVDAFSVSNPDLVGSLVEYGVQRDKIHVILTGIDAEEEFSPAHVAPVEGLEPDVAHILFAARLVEQKDPLLVVDIAAALRARGHDFRLHVVGEGELEGELRGAIRARGLERWIRLHPACPGLHRWYAACDVLLMTSRFEGVPYVVYEAMAMGLAAVVPALPGTLALLAPGTGCAVEQGDGVEGYVSALAPLLADRDRAAEIGRRARERMRTSFPVSGMADAHAELYERLLGLPSRAPAAAAPRAPAPRTAPAPLRFRTRPSRGTPRVSVIVPCFNQGDWLIECVESLRAQTYPDLELIVVDDASTEPATHAALERLERAGDVSVLRQPRNAGPSAARNRGIGAASGRYVLPVDSDNLLAEHAVAALVSQLQAAGERVGFIYPNIQYFGNREDYFEAPDHNVCTLMRHNYCDTSSLIDREVFDAGLWFPEAVVDGHEDWHFFLGLADRDVHGEPARGKTLLYRKHGFNRSDRIDHGGDRCEAEFAIRHAALSGPAVKAGWSPALSVIALEPLRASSIGGAQLEARLHAQTCRDFEVLSATDRQPAATADPPGVRWLPARPGASVAEVLQEALRRVRGRWVLVTRGAAGDVLANGALVEQLLRLFVADAGLRAVAFADAGGHDLRALGEDEVDGVAVHAVAWAVPDAARRLHGVELEPGDELDAVVRAFALAGEQVECRQLSAPAAPARGSARAALSLRLDDVADVHVLAERELRMESVPLLASAPSPSPARLGPGEEWRPVLTLPLCRHCERGGEGRVFNMSRAPVPGHEFECVLGLLRSQSLVGTARLALDPDAGFAVHARGEPLDAAALRQTLGYVEEVHFNGLDALVRGRHARTGQTVLVCGPDDPLWAALAEPMSDVGFIEREPVNPRERARGATRPRLLGLVRAADFEARRHRYGAGRVPAGRCVWELGALLCEPVDGATALMFDGDRVALATPAARARARALPAGARWALAPLGWREFGHAPERRRAALRRLSSLPRLILDGAPAPVTADAARAQPVGWLLAEPDEGRVPLYGAVHPVTGDQLLTRYRVEATETGYGEPALLGYLVARAPATGRLERPQTAIPWGSRFGTAVRWEHERGDRA